MGLIEAPYVCTVRKVQATHYGVSLRRFVLLQPLYSVTQCGSCKRLPPAWTISNVGTGHLCLASLYRRLSLFIVYITLLFYFYSFTSIL